MDLETISARIKQRMPVYKANVFIEYAKYNKNKDADTYNTVRIKFQFIDDLL